MTGTTVARIRAGRSLGQQVRLASLSAGAGTLLVLGFVLLAAVVDEPFKLLSKEPAESLGGAAYVGWMAHLGSVIWLTGAVSGVLAGWALLRGGSPEPARFLLAFGAFTALLAADDLFLLHESVYPALGVPEEGVYAAYAGLVAVLLWRCRAQLLGHDGLLVLLALGLWALSVGSDLLPSDWSARVHLVEDGTKLIGATLWTTFVTAAALRELAAAQKRARV